MKKNPVRPLRPAQPLQPIRLDALRDVTGGTGQSTGRRQHEPIIF